MRSIRARPNEPMSASRTPTRMSDVTAAALFTWKDYSRFVEVAPVERGWLVLWGTFRDAGRRRDLAGSRTYTDLHGARRRVADAVFELTRNPALVSESIGQFDRTRFTSNEASPLPEPL